MQVVTKEVALKDVEKWLEHKRISDAKRESYKDNIEQLVNGIAEGVLVLTEKLHFEQTLRFPTEGDAPITKISYKPRLAVREVNQAMVGVKASDVDARLVAYAAALSGLPKGVIAALDTEDYATVQAIVVFFV